MTIGCASVASSFWATMPACSRFSMCGSATANLLPSMRARMSASRSATPEAAADLGQQLAGDVVAERVADGADAVDFDHQQARRIRWRGALR